MAARLLTKVSSTRVSLWSVVSWRALSVGAPLCAKSKPDTKPDTDPVKQLFVDKIKEYQSAKGKSGKAPGLRAEDEEQLVGELARLKNIYGDGDLTQFPKFDFKEDIKIDWR
ncbi:ATP synthase-coupling factor 6, mitochondrial-like [Halichondria panicea]|uniref:ATP synthase-coupling factor 6, mitochondrial-like n=1 Tax=Halichondria panicea TaxID=6063 RepID=UPI00312B93DE